MPDDLRPSPDFFTDVRRILADARRMAYNASLNQSQTLNTIHDTLLPKVFSGQVLTTL
jgi:hypothetical protein